jgi:hypothetical protein
MHHCTLQDAAATRRAELCLSATADGDGGDDAALLTFEPASAAAFAIDDNAYVSELLS